MFLHRLAEPGGAADAFQRALRFRFQAPLTPSVRCFNLNDYI